MSMGSDSTRQHMLECEARHYLALGYTEQLKVDRLLRSIQRRRGERAAQALRMEMRRQWRLQQELGSRALQEIKSGVLGSSGGLSE